TQTHDRTLAELLFDLAQRGAQRLLAVVIHREIPFSKHVSVGGNAITLSCINKQEIGCESLNIPRDFHTDLSSSSSHDFTTLYIEPDSPRRLCISTNRSHRTMSGGVSARGHSHSLASAAGIFRARVTCARNGLTSGVKPAAIVACARRSASSR